jgi:hypothetical protein
VLEQRLHLTLRYRATTNQNAVGGNVGYCVQAVSIYTLHSRVNFVFMPILRITNKAMAKIPLMSNSRSVRIINKTVHSFVHSFTRSVVPMSYDRSTTPSKNTSPQTAIQYFLFQLFQYTPVCLRSSSSCLRLFPCLPVIPIPPPICLPQRVFKRQFLCKM